MYRPRRARRPRRIRGSRWCDGAESRVAVTEAGCLYWTGPPTIGQVGPHTPDWGRHRLSGGGAGPAGGSVWVTFGPGGGDTVAALDPGISAQASSPATIPIAIDPPTHSFFRTGTGSATRTVFSRRGATVDVAASVP